MTYFILFIVLSISLLIFTLRRPHRHRFLRYFAFECTLGLVVLNADSWFLDPMSPLQIVSWLLLTGSLLLALHGFHMLRSLGAPEEDLENTTKLVTTGAYRFIRHPLYASLLLLGLGAFLKSPSGFGFLILALLVVFMYATAWVEEADNLERFGQPYADYMETTKRFIPFIF
ncbi:MAG: methyltransferase [Anaerolineales bacterium]|jgi:protein-S-isoprenylcysteine O-methyltransferase Ste14